MTSLSQYLRAEVPDYTEPVSFYVPGAGSWTDLRLLVLRFRALESIDDNESDPVDDSDESL